MEAMWVQEHTMLILLVKLKLHLQRVQSNGLIVSLKDQTFSPKLTLNQKLLPDPTTLGPKRSTDLLIIPQFQDKITQLELTSAQNQLKNLQIQAPSEIISKKETKTKNSSPQAQEAIWSLSTPISSDKAPSFTNTLKTSAPLSTDSAKSPLEVLLDQVSTCPKTRFNKLTRSSCQTWPLTSLLVLEMTFTLTSTW